MADQSNPAAPAGTAATETILWESTPSSWQNFWWWISIIGIPVAIFKHIALKRTKITLTSQRITIRTGIFNIETEEIELYRVKDWAFREPLMQRLLGFGEVTVVSSDRTAPEITYRWLKDAQGLKEHLRAAVEAARQRRGVRELDLADQLDGGLGGQ
jgi:uncharacterized membrane protein YdbT with pleckstrin-like domain